MTEYDASEQAYNKGRANGIKEVFKAIDDILNIDCAHSYLSDQFLLSQYEYAKRKEKFLKESEEYMEPDKCLNKDKQDNYSVLVAICPCKDCYKLESCKELGVAYTFTGDCKEFAEKKAESTSEQLGILGE